MKPTNRFDLDLKFGQEKENELQIAILKKGALFKHKLIDIFGCRNELHVSLLVNKCLRS